MNGLLERIVRRRRAPASSGPGARSSNGAAHANGAAPADVDGTRPRESETGAHDEVLPARGETERTHATPVVSAPDGTRAAPREPDGTRAASAEPAPEPDEARAASAEPEPDEARAASAEPEPDEARAASGEPEPDGTRAASGEPGSGGAAAPPVTDVPSEPGFLERGRMRRRARFLRRLREVQLRDIGGFMLELQRHERERPELVEAKISEAASTDAELRAVEHALGVQRPLRGLREPGIGGACPRCLSVYGSGDRYCASCGQPLTPAGRRDDPPPPPGISEP